MAGKKADGMLKGDGIKWDYGRKKALPPSISSTIGKTTSTTSISQASKGRSVGVSKTSASPRKGKGIYGPWGFSKFGPAKLKGLGKKVYG